MVNFIPVIAIFFSAFTVKVITKSWLSPAAFFSLLWFMFTIFPLVFASEYVIKTSGLWYILIIVMSFSCGSLLALSFVNKQNETKEIQVPNFKKLILPFTTINFLILFGIASLLYYSFNKYGLNLTSNSIGLIPNLISIDRYGGMLNYPLIVKYSLYLIYPNNILSGILINNLKFKNLFRIYCMSPLIFAIILGIIEGSRTSILLGGVLFLSSYIGTKVKLSKARVEFSFIKIILYSFSLLFIFLSFFIYIQWLRQGLNPIIIDLLAIRIKAYFFGYLSAFTIWFDTIESIFKSNIFFSTFAGPYNLLGIIDRPLGFYSPIFINEDVSTNIFTSLRGIILDFSIFGSIILLFLIGFFIQLVFQKKKSRPFDGVITLSIFYAFTLYSPIISIFHYNSIFFSWLLIFFILRFRI